jgi:hypothetical protein
MKTLALLGALSVLVACAQPAANMDPNARRERVEAPTGSNIAKRNRDNDGSVTTYDREAVERAQAGSYGGIPRVPNN